MRKTLQFLSCFIVVGLALSLTGCPAESDGGGGDGNEGVVSFQSFSPSSVLIFNHTGERLIAFKGSVSPNTLISGIPPYAANHGLKCDPVLFSTTGDFVLVLITEAQYNTHKHNLAAATVFTRIYAFYSHESTNNPIYTISASIGGTGQLIVNNPTRFNVTLHKDSPFGETIGYVPAGLIKTVINLQAPGDYTVYPVIIYYNPITQEVASLIPKYENDMPISVSFALSGDMAYTFDLSLIGDVDFDPTSGGAYFRIINNAVTAIGFYLGSVTMLTSRGTSSINPGSNATFFINFNKNHDDLYPETQSFSSFRIGHPANLLPVTEQVYELDYVYEIEVTGSAGDLQLGTVVKKNKVDFDSINW